MMRQHVLRGRAAFLSLVLAATVPWLAGCGGGGLTVTTVPSSAPLITVDPVAPAAATPVNSYVGTQSSSTANNSGGVVLLDTNNSQSSYEFLNVNAIDFPPASVGYTSVGISPTYGPLSSSAGFLSMAFRPTGSSTTAHAYAVEVLGRAALLRPGTSALGPAFLTQNAACPSLKAAMNFNFVSLLDTRWTQAASPAYGSLQAMNSGVDWTFSSFNQFTLAGVPVAAETLPAGFCGTTQEGYAITLGESAATNNQALTIGIGPSGFLAVDQGTFQHQIGTVDPLAIPGLAGLAGVVVPSAALSSSAIYAGKYIGFEYKPQNVGGAHTFPAAFASVGSTGLAGGLYPNDADLTQAAATDTTITLGAASATNPGLYPGATVTIALPDLSHICSIPAGKASDARGNPTCTLPAVAVVGNPENKYAIFVVTVDNTLSVPMPLGIYLLQQ